MRFQLIDLLGQPKVTAGSDHCFRTCCPSVLPHFSNLAKQNNRKQWSLLARLWVWPSESLMTPVLCDFIIILATNRLVNLLIWQLYPVVVQQELNVIPL